MEKSRRNRRLLGATSLLCLTMMSGGAWAEGADAAQDPAQQREEQRRRNQQTRPQPAPQAQPQREQTERSRLWNREPSANNNPQSVPRNVDPNASNNPQTPPIQQQRRRETVQESQPQRQVQRETDRRRENDWRDNTGRNNTGQGNIGQGNTGRDNDRRDTSRWDNNRRDNDRRDNNWRDNNWRDNSRRDDDRRDGRWADNGWRGPSSPPAYRRHVYVGPHRYEVRPDRRRVYRNVVVLRPYGGWYHGYGRYYSDRDAYRWLGLTAITFGVLSMLNEYQQRALEDAQIAATTAPIGAPIVWGDPYARGTVVATRDGWSDSGHYCREFQQTVEIGGRVEQAYGTACQQPDGSWQVTS